MDSATRTLDEAKNELLSLMLQRERSTDDGAKLRARDRKDAIPLSYAQERFWILGQMGNASTYNVPVVFRLTGPLQVPALEDSISEIVRRHEILRTRFLMHDGNPVQVIDPPRQFRLNVIDVSSAGEADLSKRAIGEPFDLQSGPLFRTALFRRSEHEHVLAIVLHHIIGDGWSIGVILRELGQLYAALSGGATDAPRLPELPLQFADYAIWQREWMSGRHARRQLSYWLNCLAGAPSALDLPTDRPRPAVQSHKGRRLAITLPGEVTGSLDQLVRSEGATLFMVLLGAFACVLSRWSGQEQVVIGTPIAGRSMPDTEELVGPFLNMLPLRMDLSGDPSFREFLARVKETALNAYAHQDIPFEGLIDAMRPDRDLSRAPIFQVMIGFQHVVNSWPEATGLGITLERNVDPRTAKLDLSFYLVQTPGGLIEGYVEYATDLFERSTIARITRQFACLLTQIGERPHDQLSQLTLSDADERKELLADWNATEGEYPSTRCVHALLHAQALSTPDKIAVACGDQQISYRELDLRSNRLARYLGGLGAGPDLPVGLCVERSIDMVIGLVGILKAGAAYLPLDPGFPRERLTYMLSDAAVSLVLTQSHLTEIFADQEIRLVCLDRERDSIEQCASSFPESGTGPDNLAYILYTSGSTGRPKGVMGTHRCLVNRLQWDGGDDDDIYACRTTPNFIDVLWELFMPLTRGQKVVMVSGAATKDPKRLIQEMADGGVTRLVLVPSLLRAMLEVEEHLAEKLPQLRYWECSGEALSTVLATEFADRLPAASLLNVYGTSEFWDATSYESGRRTSAFGTPIGRPILNIKVYVLDQQLDPVAVGTVGELYVGGAGLARGYLKRPGLTAERFVPNPFTAGERLYRTGDLVRWNADGTLEFLGRIDNQVKVRGHRVETGEVEGVLCSYNCVAQAVVTAQEEHGDTRLIAYVVPVQDKVAVPDELFAHMRRYLPEYMVPSAIVQLDRLPLTPNGKLDRKALVIPKRGAGSARRNHVAPRNSTEQTLASIWSNTLRIDSIGVHDNFFELGGHSLLAIRLITRINEALSISLPLEALFRAATIESLGQVIEQSGADAAGQRIPDLSSVVRGLELPLSFAQERLWFLDQLQPGGSEYNMGGYLRVSGEFEAAALRSALTAQVARHEILRTRFESRSGRPVQVIDEGREVEFELVEVRPSADLAVEQELRRAMVAATGEPYDLSRGPLFRAKVLRLSRSDHRVLVMMHHIISDGWSLRVLGRELQALYRSFCSGSAAPLAPLPVQYADYALWQRSWLQGEALGRQLSYWRQHLEGAAVLDFPTDRARPPVQRFRGAAVSLELAGSLVGRLEELARGEGATLFMVLLAGFQVVVSRWSGQEDIVLGSPIAGRTARATEQLIGLFVNTLVLRSDLSGDPSFRGLVGRVREMAIGAYAHQDLPFEKLVEALQPERDLSRHPLFQILFNSQEIDAQERAEAAEEEPGLGSRIVPIGGGHSKFDMTLYLHRRGAGLFLNLVYNTDLFDAATMARLLHHYRNVLQGCAVDPERRISSIELLGAEERRELAEQWSGARLNYPQAQCLHALFSAQALRTPEAPAVRCEDVVLSYAELEARSNRLAHHLRSLGVGPERIVGLCVERSVSTVVGLLGILKAGGAYLPLDPAYPRERLAYMLSDAQACAVVTQSDLADRMPADIALVLLDTAADELAHYPCSAAQSGAGAGNLAYIIYTSGSTGRPKGVLVEHRQVLNYVFGITARLGMEGLRNFAMVQSFTVGSAITVLYPSLLFGGCLHIIQRDRLLDASRCGEYFVRHGIDCLKIAPSHLSALTNASVSLRGRLPSLVVVAGEASNSRWLCGLSSLQPSGRIINHYGTTETTIGVLTQPVSEVDRQDLASVPLGRPLPNCRIYILDKSLNLVPPGVVGEIYIGGDSLTRGYLGQAGMTAEKYIPDPFSQEAGSRLYCSSDLGRWLADGTVQYLGRRDHQVKIRGFRVELEEVEATLLLQQEVQQAVAVVHADPALGQRLAAYVVPAPGVSPAPEEIARRLRGSLPDYMMPSVIMVLAALPRTAHGKVDRRALPMPADRTVAAGAARTSPRTATEQAVAEIWGEVLRLAHIAPEDDFFALGGHSLLATQVVARLRDRFGIELPLRSLFERRTLADLADTVDTIKWANHNALANTSHLSEPEHEVGLI